MYLVNQELVALEEDVKISALGNKSCNKSFIQWKFWIIVDLMKVFEILSLECGLVDSLGSFMDVQKPVLPIVSSLMGGSVFRPSDSAQAN